MADANIIELLDDMHLSSQSKFSDYYYAMQSDDISYANTILNNNPELKNQMINAQNVNSLIEGVNKRELEPITDIDYYLQDLLNQFQDMINNTRIMGQFDSALQYYPHNFVYYQGKGYYAFTQPPLGTLPTDTQYWIEYDIRGLQGYGGINLNLRYNWDNNLDYKVGDVVVYKNRLWYALADNTGTVPNLNHYPWVIISLPQMPNKTPIQKAMPQSGYSTGDFWFQITEGEEVITTTWGIRQSEATPRFSSGAFTIGSNIYVVGGILPNFSLSNKNEMYDTLTRTWSEKASLSSDRARFGYFSIGDNGYVVGGLTDNGVVTNKVESYDPATNTWTTKASLPIKMITDAVSDGTYGYVFGGVNENGQIVPTSYIYNPTEDIWTAIGDKPTATRGHSLVYANGFIYAIGGINSLEETIGNVEVYDTATKTYSTRANMITPRSYLGAFYKAGIIYAVGGLDSNWYSLNINEKFNIEENQWEADMPMNYSRSSLTTAVSDGKAYAIGGIDIGTSIVGGYNEEYGIKDTPSSFDMTINTAIGGTKTFGIMNRDTSSNFYIDWGDGQESAIVTAITQVDHTYQEDGEYVVKIIGNTGAFGVQVGSASLLSVDKCSLSFTSISNMFSGCSNLNSIPSGIFDSSVTLTDANGTFNGCENLKIIPAGLFDQNVNITSFRETFKNCGLTSIPNGLFNRNNLVTTFENCFDGCSDITIIPNKLFDYNISVLDFSYCFFNCTKLETIPNNLFSKNSYCEKFLSVFAGCSSLKNTFTNIFENAIGAKDFSGLFNGCSSLDSIPEGLFKDSNNATNYEDTLKDTKIVNLPAYTFNGSNARINIDTLPLGKITKIGDYSMNGLNVPSSYFKDSVLTFIGNFVFSDNVVNYTSMFENSVSLSTIGTQDLSNVKTLENIFYGCTSLKNINGFFTKDTGEPALNKSISFTDCPLTNTSVQNIKNSLVTLTSSNPENLYLNDNSLSYLTDIEKYEIVNKYWKLPNWIKPKMTSELAEQIVQAVEGEDGYTYTQSMYETALYFEVDLINSQTTAVIMRYYVDKYEGLVYEVGQEPIPPTVKPEYPCTGLWYSSTQAQFPYLH